MPRPRVIKIGLVRWTVEWSRDAIDRVMGLESDAAGICREEEALIAVDPMPRNPIGEREILLHEILHACVGASSLDVPLEQEEPLVAAIAPRLLEALRQNRTLVTYLTEKV